MNINLKRKNMKKENLQFMRNLMLVIFFIIGVNSYGQWGSLSLTKASGGVLSNIKTITEYNGKLYIGT